MGAVLVRNFRSNSQDRDLLLFLLLLALVDVVAAPIVFCLKADGTGAVGRTPWTVIWIPMWIYNFFLLVAAISNLVTSPRSRASNHASDSGSVSGSAGGGSESGEHDSSAHLLSLEDINPFKYERNFVHRLVDFFCTTSLVTAQVFITMMMDGDLPSWTWAQVFIPVYIYEACWCWKYLYRSLNTREEPQEIIAYRARSHSPVEDPQAAGEADLAHMKLLEYFQHNELCANAREQLFLLMFWIWQTIFLMVYFDGRVDWAWGLILLPAWVYLFARAVLVYSGYHAAKRIRAGLDLDAIAIGLDRDIEHHARAAHGERVHATATAMMCCTAPFLYFFVMLVCTLRGDNISTFWIFVPVWVWVAILLSLSCCLCCVLTVCNLEASAADTENMPVPVHADATATSNTQSTPIVVAYEPPTLPVQTMPSTAVSAVPIDSRGIAIVVRDSDDLD